MISKLYILRTKPRFPKILPFFHNRNRKKNSDYLSNISAKVNASQLNTKDFFYKFYILNLNDKYK